MPSDATTPESSDYKSVWTTLIAVYLLLLLVALLMALASVWPPAAASKDTTDTLVAEALHFDSAATSAAGIVPRTAADTGERLKVFLADSARRDTLAAAARARAVRAHALADSARGARLETLLQYSDVTLFFVRVRHVSLELRLVLLALVVGALGAFVHAAQSFASYVGSRRFLLSWSWWYVLRPAIGSVVGLVFYFVVRGALFPSTIAVVGEISPLGVAALAALGGLLSKQVADKLAELLNNVRFLEKGDATRTDRLPTAAGTPGTTGAAGTTGATGGVPVPATQIEEFEQDPTQIGAGPLRLDVSGKGFPSGAVLHIDGAAMTMQLATATELVGTVPTARLHGAGEYTLQVRDSAGVAVTTPTKVRIR